MKYQPAATATATATATVQAAMSGYCAAHLRDGRQHRYTRGNVKALRALADEIDTRMYPVLISMVFTLLVLAMIPRDKPAFDPDAFMNPPAAASTAEAETHAHNLTVFAEAVMKRLAEQPDRLPGEPARVRVDALDQGRGLDPVLPAAYRATMPWEALFLPVPGADSGGADSGGGGGADAGAVAGLNGIGAVVAFVNPVNLPRRIRSVDVARGLKLTAGDDVPVGLVRDGVLLSEGLVSPGVATGFGQVRNLPLLPELQNAPAIVVCLDLHFCGAPPA